MNTPEMNAPDAPDMIAIPATAARLLAIEILLAAPETLENDALESDLYILRDRLLGQDAD